MVHSCINVRSSRYKNGIRNAAKLSEEHVNLCFVIDAYAKKQWKNSTGKREFHMD